MMARGDSNLISFAAGVIEQHDGVVETHSDHIMTLLPSELAQRLGLPEEARIGQDGIPLLYGSPVLNNLILLATSDVPIVYGKLEIPYLKKAGFEAVLGNDLHLVSGRMKISSMAESLTSYTVLVCHYVAVSDERKEGLVEVASSESSGCVIPGFEELRNQFLMSEFPKGQIPTQFQASPGSVLEKPLERAQALVKQQLTGFFSTMQRRLERDVRNTREYYIAMEKEIVSRPGRANLGEAQQEQRKQKIAGLPNEMLAKIADLQHRYSVRVTIEPRGALRVLVPVVRVLLQISYRNLKRSFGVIWNPVTRRLDPVCCECCGDGTRVLYSAPRSSELKMLCTSCSKGKKSH